MNERRGTKVPWYASFLIFLLATACASTSRSVTPKLAAATNELVTTARRHRVAIRTEHVSFSTDGSVVVAHVPLEGIERYTDADFAVGAPIQIIYVASPYGINLPEGSYLVKAQFQAGATEGTALFIGDNGTTAAQRKITISDRVQAAAVFPDVYSDSPAAIPVVTSTHFFVNRPGQPGEPPVTQWVIDCAGWIPYRVLLY